MKFAVATLLAFFLSIASAGDAFWQQGVTGERFEITVYRSASCGCCQGWIDHLEEHNFEVKDVTVDNVEPYKKSLRVPPQGASCHTAVVDGIVIEGHVPAQDIKRLLSSDHDIRLLTVPAMPSGTPGMDPPGAPKQAFDVYAISHGDVVSIYNRYSNY